MMKISDFSDDLIGEILSRAPITSLSALRSTCKRWNNLSETHVFGKKAARNHQQFLGFVLMNYRICSFRFNLQGEDEILLDASVKKTRKLENVEISQVSQCDGLLLCLTKDHSSLLVWNPYLGQTRWIKPTTRNSHVTYNSYALGYEDNKNNNRNHKIMRFILGAKYEIEVYDFSSNAWKVVDVSLDRKEYIMYNTNVALKGNTYFLSTNYIEYHHLLSFDFTEERFGPCLPLPFIPLHTSLSVVTLSCVRDEKLALLYYHYETLDAIKIWISTKIEPNAISWSMFLKVDRENLPPELFPHYFGRSNISFFIDEDKKIAVLSRKRDHQKANQRLYIIEEDRFIKYVDVGQDMEKNDWDYRYLMCSSYVPSLVQFKVNQL